MKKIKENKNSMNRNTTSKDFSTNDGKFLDQECIHGKGVNFLGNIFNA